MLFKLSVKSYEYDALVLNFLFTVFLIHYLTQQSYPDLMNFKKNILYFFV